MYFKVAGTQNEKTLWALQGDIKLSCSEEAFFIEVALSISGYLYAISFPKGLEAATSTHGKFLLMQQKNQDRAKEEEASSISRAQVITETYP